MKSSFRKLTALLQQARSDHYFSGASLLVFYEGEILFQEEVGETCWKIEAMEPETVGKDTLFDLASLTKPLATVFLTALLTQEKEISLEDRVGELLDQPLSEEIRNTPVRALLNHSSGFPDWKPYFSELFPEGNKKDSLSGGEAKRALFQKVHREPFIYPPGEKSLYSDLGFILLGEILEERSGQSLDQLAIGEARAAVALPAGAAPELGRAQTLFAERVEERPPSAVDRGRVAQVLGIQPFDEAGIGSEQERGGFQDGIGRWLALPVRLGFNSHFNWLADARGVAPEAFRPSRLGNAPHNGRGVNRFH